MWDVGVELVEDCPRQRRVVVDQLSGSWKGNTKLVGKKLKERKQKKNLNEDISVISILVIKVQDKELMRKVKLLIWDKKCQAVI